MIRILSSRLLIASLLLTATHGLISITSITTSAAFNKSIQNNEYVIVDFYMTHCGPCQTLAPILAQVEAALPQVSFLKVNIQDQGVANLSGAYNIRAVPAVIMFKNGKEVGRVVGNNKTADEWIATIKAALHL